MFISTITSLGLPACLAEVVVHSGGPFRVYLSDQHDTVNICPITGHDEVQKGVEGLGHDGTALVGE